MGISRKIKKKRLFHRNSKLTEYEGYLEEGREGGGGSLSLVMRLAVAWQSHDGTRSALPGNIDVVGYH